MQRLGASRWLRSSFLGTALLLALAGDAVRLALSWWVYGALALATGVVAVLLLVATRRRWRLNDVPYPLAAFLVLTVLSLAWSRYPSVTAVGIAATLLGTIVALALAAAFSWRELARGLDLVLRWVLGLSLAFELFVSLVLRAPLLPFFPTPGARFEDFEIVPNQLHWSTNMLLTGGRIQGIVGNANNLAILALLALIVLALRLADGEIRRRWAVLWLAVAGLTLLLADSATVTIVLVAVALITGCVLALRRVSSESAHVVASSVIAVVVAAVAAVGVIWREAIFGLLGRSDDLTGRIGIWQNVVELAAQRPVAGWGWAGFWMPWADPFNSLAFVEGVRQLQAHNAWLDVWLQLGIVGVLVLAALVLRTLTRAWWLAVDRPHPSGRIAGPRTALAMLPLLLLTALLVQSATESRLLTEFGWLLLVLIAAKTKAPPSAARGSSPSELSVPEPGRLPG